MNATSKAKSVEQGPERNGSPDWLQQQNGQSRRTHEQTVPGEGHTELKYRSVDNFSLAKLAKGIGIFSIALGLAEVFAPARLGAAIGVDNRFRKFLPLLGAREIAHGIGIMASTKPTTAMWTRIPGDVIDLAYLGAAFQAPETNKRRLAGAAAAVMGVAVLDLVCAKQLGSREWSETDGNPNAPTTVGQSSAR